MNLSTVEQSSTKQLELPSVIDRDSALRAFLTLPTNDVPTSHQLFDYLLQALPHVIEPGELAGMQMELYGRTMRWAFRISRAYNRLWTMLGWDGVTGLDTDAAAMRVKTTFGQLLGSDWCQFPDQFTWATIYPDYPAVPICVTGRTCALRYQLLTLVREFEISRPDSMLRLWSEDTELSRFESAPVVDPVYGITGVHRLCYPLLASPVTWWSLFEHTMREHKFCIVFGSGCELQAAVASAVTWNAPAADVLVHFDAMPAETSNRLQQLGVCKRTVRWWPGGGDMPVLQQCRFNRLHSMPALQRLEQDGADLLVTDFSSFSCPVVRVVSRFNVLLSPTHTSCACGRFDTPITIMDQPHATVRTLVGTDVSTQLLSHLITNTLGTANWRWLWDMPHGINLQIDKLTDPTRLAMLSSQLNYYALKVTYHAK